METCFLAEDFGGCLGMRRSQCLADVRDVPCRLRAPLSVLERRCSVTWGRCLGVSVPQLLPVRRRWRWEPPPHTHRPLPRTRAENTPAVM